MPLGVRLLDSDRRFIEVRVFDRLIATQPLLEVADPRLKRARAFERRIQGAVCAGVTQTFNPKVPHTLLEFEMLRCVVPLYLVEQLATFG